MTSYKTLTPYLHQSIEDWGGVVSEDFKTFAKKWKNFVRKMCSMNEWKLCWFNTGHYYCSWMIQNGERYIYCSFSDVRYFNNEWYKMILYRTAKHDRDYTGGTNNYTSLESLETSIKRLFERSA